MKFSKLFFLVLASVVFIQGCSESKERPSSPITTNTTPTTGANDASTTTPAILSCATTVPATVVNGVPASIIVTGNGGTTPYSLPAISGTFNPSTTILRTYANATTTSIVVNDQVTVADKNGNQATCSFKVTVQPSAQNPSTLACSLVATPSSVAVNGMVGFLATSSGGTGARSFQIFSPGDSAVIVTAFDPATGTAQAKYTTSGLKTAIVTVSDAANNTAACSTVVTVNPAPTISVAVSPSSTQVEGNSFVLTASVSNFINPPTTYSFVPSNASVAVTQSSPSSNVASLLGSSAITFDVTVTASNASESVSTVLTLTYTQSPLLACNLNHPVGTYYPNDLVPFTVTATNGEPLLITDGLVDGGTGTFAGNNLNARFFAAGTKVVSVHARSITTGKICNAGAYVTDSVVISEPTQLLTCNVFSYTNPARNNQWFYTNLTPSYQNGWVQILPANGITTGAITNVGTYQLDGLTNAWVAMYYVGTYNLTYHIKDYLTGREGECSFVEYIVQ